MTLNELVELIKKSYAFILLLGVVSIIVAAGYIYRDNPSGDQGFGKLPRPEIASILSGEIQVVNSPRIRGSRPKLIEIYKFDAGKIDPAELARKLGVAGEPIATREVLTWVNPSRVLSVENEISFTFQSLETVGPGDLEEEEALEIARNQLRQLGLFGNDVSLEVLQTRYITDDAVHPEEVPGDKEFNIFVFDFGAKLGGLNLVRSNGDKTIYSVSVAKDKKVKKLSGMLLALVFSEKSTYPVKHFSTVRSEIEKGKVKVINTASQVVQNIQRLEFPYNNWELVYYLTDEESDYLQPVFILGSTQALTRTTPFLGALEALKDSVYK